MANSEALDLSSIDPAHWRVLSNSTVYGPYTLAQMQTFVREGRVSASTKVAEGDGGAFLKAGEHGPLARFLSAARPVRERVPDDEPQNYMVVTSLKGIAPHEFTSALNVLGRFAEVMPGTWVLRSRERPAIIRKTLNSVIEISDKVMIMNATTGRLAWFNLGPDADVHIRKIWDSSDA